MSFSFSFCLTNTGNIPAGSLINFYSNSNNYDEPPFLSNIPLDDITGTNCPYILTNIPIGTTKILIKDTNSSCCVTIDVLPNNLCDTCDLGFDVYSASTISTIVAGLLTGSCDNNITDYLIYWYNFDDLTQPYCTSGYGTEFAPYQHTHPLTGLQSIPVIGGEYVAFIQKIKINGINFSIIEEPGFVQANLNCFNNLIFEVESFTCSNGNQSGDYDHLIHYSGASIGVIPPSVQTTFELSPTTNYFAWRFNAFDVPDSLKITYYGSYYNNEPIVLEYINAGRDNPGMDLYVTPKIVKTNSGEFGVNKVICLTGLTRSVNDYLEIKIIPNQLNNVTNYLLKFICLESFDCDICFNDYLNIPYKLVGSLINVTPRSCNLVEINLSMYGCSYDELVQTEIWKYYYTSGISSNPGIFWGDFGGSNYIIPRSTTLYFNAVGCNIFDNQVTIGCQPPSSNTITFLKDNSGDNGTGKIYMTFSNIIDFNAYYNSYLFQINNSPTPITTDNTNLNYYKYLRLQVPDFRYVLNPENIGCGDGTYKIDYIIHTSSVVTTGYTNFSYTLEITMPSIVSGMTFTNCELNCTGAVEYFVNNINSYSTYTGLNQSYTTNTGNRVTTPFYLVAYVYSGGGAFTGTSFSSHEDTSEFYNTTFPMSGDNYTVIPELSSNICPVYGNVSSSGGYLNYQKQQYNYTITLTNPNNVTDFKINVWVISNGALQYNSGTPVLLTVYEYQNGVVIYSNPNYVIGSIMFLSSYSFTSGEEIAINYKSTICNGAQNYSPGMTWSLHIFNYGPTLTLTSYEILCLDMDTTGYSGPNGEFVHWNVKGIDPSQTFIDINGSWIGSPNILPTDWEATFPGSDAINGWNGPCPPVGQTHRYTIQVKAILSDNSEVISNVSTFTSST